MEGVGGAYTRRLLVLRSYALLAQRQDFGVFEEDERAKQLLEVPYNTTLVCCKCARFQDSQCGGPVEHVLAVQMKGFKDH